MKAGLAAHLTSLKGTKKEELEEITGANLLQPGNYNRLIAERKAAHEPIPPGSHIRHCGHHWLKFNPQLSGSADNGSWMVAQWSAKELCWYRSDEVGTCMKPLGKMDHWDYVIDIPLPTIEQEEAARTTRS
jgi:hypothetical protein